MGNDAASAIQRLGQPIPATAADVPAGPVTPSLRHRPLSSRKRGPGSPHRAQLVRDIPPTGRAAGSPLPAAALALLPQPAKASVSHPSPFARMPPGGFLNQSRTRRRGALLRRSAPARGVP